jgi:hypothetical protein
MSQDAAKLVLGLAARGEREAPLVVQLRELAAELRTRLSARGGAVLLLTRLPDDPFGRRGLARPYEATLELRAAEPATLVDAARGLAARLTDVAHLDLSAALLGVDDPVVPAENPAPVRLQYLMRRRADLSHAQYLAHYREIHAEFGRRTPGIRSYTQFQIDPEASRSAAASLGFGISQVDSITELQLESADTFLSAISGWADGPKAIADERNFVDRRNSPMFCSELVPA